MSIKNGMHAHFDCFSGISGDMVLGAFNDMGVPTQWLIAQIGKLGIDNVEISFEDVRKNGIGAKKARIVETDPSHARNFKDILQLIESGEISEFAKNKAKQIFSTIAEAESRIHRCKLEDVHFHEVGALDSIVDIVGTALCLDYFNIETVSSSALPLGSGFVECSHGRLPVPAPATLEILKGLPVHGGDATGEMVTPTGAGIVATLAQTFGPIPSMQIERVGYGSGSIDRENVPNLLRIMAGSRVPESAQDANDDICVVETNIDDMNPELFGYLMEKLLSDGALDVCFIPVIMKKKPARNKSGSAVLSGKTRKNRTRPVDRNLDRRHTLQDGPPPDTQEVLFLAKNALWRHSGQGNYRSHRADTPYAGIRRLQSHCP